MAKGRKKKTTTETTGTLPGEPAASTATAVMEAPATEAPLPEQPPFEPTGSYTPEQNDPNALAQQARGRYRSFTTDPARGYTKLVDNEKRRLVLVFDQKPAEDVRTAMKGAGFQYHPDYDGHQHAWTRYNDHEGRLQTEAIEKLIRDLNPGTHSPER